MTDRYSYDAYGRLENHEGTADTPFLYNGRDGVMTDKNGLYYMRARYYMPEARRFISEDIVIGNIQNSQSLNRYAYVQGNPVCYVDPLGLYTISTGRGGTIGGGLGITGSFSIAVDDEGNVAKVYTVGVGGTTPVMGAGTQIQITGADSVESLKGLGIAAGGSATILGGGIEYVSGKNPDGTSWWGIEVSIGPSNVIVPAEAHAYETYTWVKSVFPQDISYMLSEIDNIIGWLNNYLSNDQKAAINALLGENLLTVDIPIGGPK